MTPLTVAWITDFPLEWLPGMPDPIPRLPKEHPATWEMVLLEELQDVRSFEIHVVVLRKHVNRSFSFRRNGVTFHVLKYFGGLRAPSLFWADTLLVGQELRRIRPDLVHAWGNERGAGLVASRLPWPYVVTIQGLFGWIRKVLPSLPGTRLPAFAERLSLARARHVTTESTFAVHYLRERYRGLTVHQAEHAPNPVFARVERLTKRTRVRFVTNGTIGFLKGTDLFLKALAALDLIEFEAVVIGAPNASFLQPLRNSLPRKLWQRVTFKSGLTPGDVADELAQATMFVLPTRVDTSPNAVKEAVVAGVPVIASNVGGIPDYVVPGGNGFLHAPGDLGELVTALRQALAHPLFSEGAVDKTIWLDKRAYLSPRRMAENFTTCYKAIARQAR